MFTKDIRNILITGYMSEFDETGSNCFSYAMVWECNVALTQSRVRNRTTLDNGCIVSKQHQRENYVSIGAAGR